MADWLPQTWRSLPGTEVKAKPWSGGRVRSGAEILPRKWQKQRRLTEQKMIEGGTETDLETNLGREREREIYIYNIVFIHCKRWYGKVFAIVRMDKFTLQGAPKEMPRKSMVTFAHCTRMPWGQWATRRGWTHTQQIKVWWRRMRKHNRRGFPMLLSANRSLQFQIASKINMAHAAACKHSMGCHVSFVSMRVEVRVEQPQDVNTFLFPTSRGLLRLPKF